MRTRETAIVKPAHALFCTLWLLPLLATVLVFTAGCGSFRLMPEEEKPVAEVAVENPPAYGTVAKVTSGAMADKENRLGDIVLTIELDDGQVVLVIQSQDDVYTPGDRVRVIRDGKGFVRAQVI